MNKSKKRTVISKMHTLLCSATDAQVLAAVRVIVREFAKRNGEPDGSTTAFIKQVRAKPRG